MSHRALIFLVLLLTGIGNAQHKLFNEILQKHVSDGHVAYGTLKNDTRLSAYLEQLSDTKPDTIKDEAARLAFWINAYNAFTLKIIADNYPIESINDLHTGGLIIGTIIKKTIWHKKWIIIADQNLSLNNIEHDIIRKEFDDPRIHFALVCAAKSCPPLRSEAYTGTQLDAQLEDQARLFFSQKSKNRFNRKMQIAYLSKIMDWYEDDFGNGDKEVLVYVSNFLPEDLMKSIQTNTKKWKVKYTHYDWSLNE